MFHPKRRKTILFSIAGFVLIVGVILYGLANRYLIEHVEAVVAAQPAAVPVSAAAGDPNSASSASSPGSTAAAAAPSSASSAGTGSTSSAGAASVSDDWNYVSADKEIHIKKAQTGSGNDTVTYYTADVKLKTASSMLSAFAKNEFGRNITENTSAIAAENKAVFAINGDYYGFRSDGVIIRNGTLYRNQPARTGLALFADGTMKSYDENTMSADSLLKSGALQTLSFGPALVQNGKATTDFSGVKIDTNFGNRTIDEANPRTGVGLIGPNHYLFIVVDGRSPGYSKGLSLSEFAQLFVKLGCTEAYNLDGGGSSTMYFNGKVVNNPLGKGNERGVSDILYVAK